MIKEAKRMQEIVSEVETLQELMDSDAANVTPENEKKFKELLAEGEAIQVKAANAARITGMKNFLTEPEKPLGGDGEFSQKFTGFKSIGESFIESENFKSAQGTRTRGTQTVEAKGFIRPMGFKAIVDTATAATNPNTNYTGGMIMVEQQRLTVAQLFAQGQTTSNHIDYMKETSFTNAADMVAEGALKPEATFVLETAQAPVRKIAVTAKVTDEMFADFPYMRDYINNRLRFMVEQKEEQQVLAGAGTGQQITGVLNTTGIQTQAMGADTAPDAIHKALTKIRTVGFFEPDGIVIHPNDWQQIRLGKDLNGQYYGGGPFTGPYGNGGIAGDTLWGMRVVVTTAITEGTALVGAFKLGGQVFYREGITVESTNTNEDDFVFNLRTIRVEERLALCIYRPLAFCTVTGI